MPMPRTRRIGELGKWKRVEGPERKSPMITNRLVTRMILRLSSELGRNMQMSEPTTLLTRARVKTPLIRMDEKW